MATIIGGGSSNFVPGGQNSPASTGGNGLSSGFGGSGGGAGAGSGGAGGTTLGAAYGTGGAGGVHGYVGGGNPFGNAAAGTSGGAGGAGSGIDGDGGGGGGGGYGVVVTSFGTLGVFTGSVSGGAGGAGGNSQNWHAGSGGRGGIGLWLDSSAGTFLTIGASVSGGAGGVRGISGPLGVAASHGAGGEGIYGSNLTMTLATGSSVTGGLSGDGVTRSNAIYFEAGTNVLEIQGGTITGNVQANGVSDTLSLGGITGGSFDVSTLGASGKYRGFEQFGSSGSATWTLTGTNTASQSWTAASGTLLVNGNMASTAFTVTGSSMLGGTGTVGAVTVQNNGGINPGDSHGILNTGNLHLSRGTLRIEIGGTTAGSTYDQVNVTGTVTLAGSLDVFLINGFMTSASNRFTIINNDGVDAVSGTLDGLDDGAVFYLGGRSFRIDYDGGDGNDVVLTALSPAPTQSANTGATLTEGNTFIIIASHLAFADSDQTAANLVYTITTPPIHGSLFRLGVPLSANDTFSQHDIDNGLVTYIHNGSETTSDGFGFSISDGQDNTVTGQSFAFTVTPVNDAPVVATAIADQSATEDQAFVFQFAPGTFADADGDTLTYTATHDGGSALPSWLTFDAVTRTFSGIPANGDVGTLSVTVTASDGTATVSENFDIVVGNTNDAPTLAIAIGNQIATEDQAFVFQFAVNTFADVDLGDTLTYSATLAGGSALPSWLTFDAATRTFSGIPANGDVGTVFVTVTASDGSATVSENFDIVVSNTNDAPVLATTIANQSATQDQAFVFQFASNTFADADGDALTYSATLAGGSALPSWLTFDAATRTFSGIAANGDVGTLSVTVTASDGTATVSENFDIVVGNTNDAPVLATTIANQSATQDQAFVFQFASNTFADADGDTLTYTATGAGGSALPSWLTFDAVTRTFSGLPANGDVGTVSVTVTASDGAATVSENFNIVVGNTNDAPIVANAIANQSATEDAAFTFQFVPGTFADADGDTLIYTASLADGSGLPSWLSFDAVTRTFFGTPENGDVGTVSVRVTASDGSLSTSDTFDIVVANTNDAPTLANAISNQSATEDSAFSFQFASNTFADVDLGDTLTFTATLSDGSALPAWLSFNPGTRTFFGTPANSDVGTVSVRVTAADGSSASASDTFDIVVANSNDAPTLANAIANQSATEDSAFSFQFASNTFADADGDTLTYSATLADGSALPSWLSFDAATRTFSGIPANGDVGTVSVRVNAADGSSASVSDSFDIVVANTNDTPVVATAIANQSATEDQAFTLSVVQNFADVDAGDALTYTATLSDGSALPSWLSLDAATGTFSGTPANGDVAALDVKVTATDGANASVSQSFVLTVANVNDAPTGIVVTPVGGKGALAVAENADGAVIGTVATMDPDTGDTFSYGVDDARFEIVAGQLKLKAGSALDYEREQSVAVTVTSTDAGGLSHDETVTIVVTDRNDMPVPSNTAPVVASQIADQRATSGTGFTFAIPQGAFVDPDGNPLLYSVSGLPSWLSFDAATQTFAGTPAGSDAGVAVITVTADDGALSVSDTFNLVVADPGNPDSQISLSADTIAENSARGTVIGELSGTDGDGVAFVSYALGDNPGRSFRIVDGELVVARHAKLDFETRAQYEITVIATDRNGVSVEESLTINVSDVAENPRGTRHNDRLAGDALDNIINGRRGNDRLTGGDGADTFVFGRHYGTDVIGDFDPSEGDVIDLSRAAGIRDLADLLANHVDDSGPHLRITAGDGSVLVIRNFDNAAELTEGMFVF